jgi:hypothetical protein
MPRNTTGGSGHKSQRNSESTKVRNNRDLVDDLLSDYHDIETKKRQQIRMTEEEKIVAGVHVARVNRRMGQGRMEVFYTETREDKDEGKRQTEHTRIAPLRGGLRGKGKKSVWVDTGSIVMVMDTGLGGAMSHEIVAVFNEEQVSRLRKIRPDMDARLFVKGEVDDGDDKGIVFEAASETDDEVDVDDI